MPIGLRPTQVNEKCVLSSSALTRERARVEALHIRRYIQKPTDLDEFLKIGGAVKEPLSETESH